MKYPILKFLSKGSSYIFILFYSAFAFSQNDSYMSKDAFLATNNLASTPSGAGNLSGVDMFRGKANTNIPIYNYKGREINLPISLNYVAGGIKVDQVAGNVGLGWQLNVGGRIERVVTNMPDDNIYPLTEIINCAKREIDVAKNKDFYKVSAPGFEDIFKFTYYQVGFKSLKNPKNIIERTNMGYSPHRDNGDYTITAVDGTKYYFGQNDAREKIYSTYTTGVSTSCPPIKVESTTAMMLTKIVSKNGMDEYVFNYKAFEWADAVTSGGTGYSIFNSATQQVEFLVQGYTYKLRQQGLTSIYHNGEKIIGFEYDNLRQDLNFVNGEGFKLSKIVLYNFKSNTPFQTANFNYSYFGTPPPAVNPGNTGFEQRRLKLDNLTFYGYEGTTPIAGDTYGFSYISPELVPKLSSNARDLMGFYNGVTTNTHLLYSEAPNSHGSIRTHVFDKSIIGTLDKITYPTKGYTKFEYEPNAIKGGFGHDLIPGGTNTVYDKEELAFVSVGGNFAGCGIMDSSTPPASMNEQRFYNFPNSEQYPSSAGGLNILQDVRSVLLRLDASTGKDVFINKYGDGLYMIQKIQNCNINNDYEHICTENSTNNVHPYLQNADCMHPISQLFITPTAHSQPSEYILGGLTSTSDLTVPYTFSEYGTYQITLWNYSSWGPGNGAGATLSVYKLNPRTVTLPDQVVSRDVTDCIVDGFRVKSITNFTANNVFASKKLYKYNGYMVDRIPGADVLYLPGSGIRSSRGFANPEIIHYQRVYEIPVDAGNVHNGYVEYLFKDFEYANEQNCDHRFSPTSVTPFFYNNMADEEVITNYVEGHFDLVHKKNIYNKNEKLVRSENYTYDNLEFDNCCYSCGSNNGPEKYHFSYLKNSTVKDYTENNTFTEKETVFSCDEFGLIRGKIVYGADTNVYENYSYYAGQLLLDSDWKSGNKNYIFTNSNGKNLISEVQTSFGNAPFETKLKYEYDSEGNPVTTIRFTPGTLTPASYETTIWGYGNRFPIATISGKKHSEISLATLTIINEIKAASNLPVTVVNENALRTKFDALRTALPECQVTTSTCNPVFGVTSTTDAKGYTVYYEYDVFGRLRYTKEKNALGNIVILSENNYNNRAN